MEIDHDTFEAMMILYLLTAFARNGSITPTYDEHNSWTGFVIKSDEHCSLTKAECPYCQGNDNDHLVKDSGVGIAAKNMETTEENTLEINLLHCNTCFNFWMMLVSNTGETISLGSKPYLKKMES